MRIWHILSRERLQQKLVHARNSQEQLLFTKPSPDKDISNGDLNDFIYCLPSLVGGACFSNDPDLAAIQIDLKPVAKIEQFRGNPNDLNFHKLQSSADGVDMRIEKSEDWPIRFRQILIWNPEVVLNWSSDPSLIEKHFLEELSNLENGALPRDDFFMTDFAPLEQLAQAIVLGRQLGISIASELSHDNALAIITKAHNRLCCP